jgi:hypothetical protein
MIPDELRDKHALAIGKIAIAWNEYHELLGELFAGMFTRSHWETSLSLWHCLDSDRTQRKLLRAATETYLHWNKRGQEELRWLLNKTDTILAQQRNVGVHAPLMSLWEIDGSHKILPLAMMGNRNAKQIEGKDILQEYAHYERQIRKMYGFALGLKVKVGFHGRDPDASWPKRPQISGSAPT